MEWKWSIGDKYEKSMRYQHTNQHTTQQPTKKEVDSSAQHQSLLSENDIWSLEEPQIDFMKANKREETYNKMSEREMMCQVGQNPFMKQNNYVNDITTHEQFLKPISTTIEREIK